MGNAFAACGRDEDERPAATGPIKYPDVFVAVLHVDEERQQQQLAAHQEALALCADAAPDAAAPAAGEGAPAAGATAVEAPVADEPVVEALEVKAAAVHTATVDVLPSPSAEAVLEPALSAVEFAFAAPATAGVADKDEMHDALQPADDAGAGARVPAAARPAKGMAGRLAVVRRIFSPPKISLKVSGFRRKSSGGGSSVASVTADAAHAAPSKARPEEHLVATA
jgi:hypothetical protein